MGLRRRGLLLIFLATVHFASGVAAYSPASVCRGGAEKLASAEQKIHQFLSTRSDGEFYIQGWRWHSMALAREAGLLQKLAQRVLDSGVDSDADSLQSLQQAADYVVNFNMKGLHKIEGDLFFPWARNKVSGIVGGETAKAFGLIMDALDKDRKEMDSLGNSVVSLAGIASNLSTPKQARLDALRSLSEKSGAIADCARSMLQLEDKLLVPIISRVVPASEQKSFNDKVIRNLGILNSRLYLVGMYEAVEELNDERERDLFKKSIPSLPRLMIPRWKRNLYEPRVGVLNEL